MPLSVEARLIDNVSKAMKGMGQNVTSTASRLTNSFKSLGKNIFNIQNLLVGAGLIGAFNMTVGAAGKFESKMMAVATLSEEMANNIGSFSKEILDLSAATGQGLDTLTTALYDSVSAGVEAGDAMEFLGVATKLAIGGATETSVAVDGLTTILNSYSMETSQAMDVSNAFFTAMKFGKTTVGELAAQIGPLAPTARAAGLAFDEMLGGVSALTKAGFSTSEAVVSLQGALVSMNSLAPEAIKKMQSMGLAYKVTGKDGEGFIDILQNIEKAGGGTLEGVKELIPNIQGVKSILALATDEGKNFLEVMKLMGDRAGETAKAYEKMSNTFEFKSARVKQSFNTAFIEMGNQIMPIIEGLADSILKNMDIIKGIIAFSGAVIHDVFQGIVNIINIVRGSIGVLVTGFIEGIRYIVKGAGFFTDKFKGFEAELETLSTSAADFTIDTFKKVGAAESELVNLFTKNESMIAAKATRMKDLTDAEKALLQSEKDRAAAAEAAAAAAARISEEELQKKNELIETAKQLQAELHVQTLDGQAQELAAFQLWYDEKAQILTDGEQALTTLESVATKKRFDIKQKYLDKEAKENAEAQAKLDRDTKKEKDLQEERTNAYIDGASSIIGSLGRLTTAMGISGKAQKKIAMVEAIVQGALAIQKALAGGVPPFNLIQAAVVGTATAANVATIAAQNFQTGGFPVGANALVRVNEADQESILNARATRNIGVGGVNALNSGQSVSNNITNEINYNPTFNMTSNTTAEAFIEILKDGRYELQKMLQETNTRS